MICRYSEEGYQRMVIHQDECQSFAWHYSVSQIF